MFAEWLGPKATPSAVCTSSRPATQAIRLINASLPYFPHLGADKARHLRHNMISGQELCFAQNWVLAGAAAWAPVLLGLPHQRMRQHMWLTCGLGICGHPLCSPGGTPLYLGRVQLPANTSAPAPAGGPRDRPCWRPCLCLHQCRQQHAWSTPSWKPSACCRPHAATTGDQIS